MVDRALKAGARSKPAGAPKGDAMRGAFVQFVEFRLFPGAGAFGESEPWREENTEKCGYFSQTSVQVCTSIPIGSGDFRVSRSLAARRVIPPASPAGGGRSGRARGGFGPTRAFYLMLMVRTCAPETT